MIPADNLEFAKRGNSNCYSFLMSSCSIIIPVHNRASLTRQCLNRLLQLETTIHPKIIVIDGASTDLTAETLNAYGEQIRAITLPDNPGFAAACNLGATLATTDTLIFLNNDTLPQPGWLENLLDYARAHPHAAMIGAKLLYPDDTVQHAGVVICQDHYPRHIYTSFPADHPAVNKSRPFQIVTAACALVRRDLFAAFDGFDLSYSNGYEDVDFCLRLGAAGHEIHYCHTAVLIHLESATRPLQAPEKNLQLYRERWLARVVPDEFNYYLEDGLIEVDYSPSYPLQMKISPLLSTLRDETRETKLDDLLNLRAHQSSQTRRELVELYAELGHMRTVRSARSPVLSAINSAAVIQRPPLVAPLPPTQSARLIATGKPYPLKSNKIGPLYSILMPVKNGALLLAELLPRLLSQQATGSIEIIAVDSSSNDETLEILNQYRATILSIPPDQFNHGLTRNLAAQHAHGDIFIFLNQSALPADEHWLANLVAPLAQDPALAGVCSRLLPRENADLLPYRDVLRDPNSADTSHITAITNWNDYQSLDPDALRLFINFHSISAAVRPQVLKQFPLPAVSLIGEDLAWAKQVLEAGYKLRHEASSIVYHSHSYSHAELLERNFDDAVLNHALVGRQVDASSVLHGIVASMTDDWRFLEQSASLSQEKRETLYVESIMRRAAEWVGQWLGGHLADLPPDAISHLSLTENLKRHASPAPPSLPPPDLRLRVIGTRDADTFLLSAEENIQDFTRCLDALGHSWMDFKKVLEFGCGCGRLTRRLQEKIPAWRIVSTDIDKEAVAWVQTNLPLVDARVNEPLPPLPFGKSHFDLVIVYSVFTHLDAHYQDSWLAELARVTTPGALLLVTVHGAREWEALKPNVAAGSPNFQELESQLTEEGMLYWTGDQWERYFPDFYHTAWHLPAYIHSHWSNWFDVLDIVEGGAHPTHDIVVLRRSG